MTYFRSKTIRGTTYELAHLDPFTFELLSNGQIFYVNTIFSHHCFTEKLQVHHRLDVHYTHKLECRAFANDRYDLSKLLPGLIKTLGNKSVYHSSSRNFFVLRQNVLPTYPGPYLVFFQVTKARAKDIDVIFNIESGYLKPGMADFASPVRFSTLIEAKARNRRLAYGPPLRVKRK